MLDSLFKTWGNQKIHNYFVEAVCLRCIPGFKAAIDLKECGELIATSFPPNGIICRDVAIGKIRM